MCRDWLGPEVGDPQILRYVWGNGDRCRWTIIQPGPRFATTKVTRPLAIICCPSLVPVMVSNPAITTVLSSTAKASELSRLAVRGLSILLNAASKYLRISSGFVRTTFPHGPDHQGLGRVELGDC